MHFAFVQSEKLYIKSKSISSIYCENCRQWLFKEGLDGRIDIELFGDVNKTTQSGLINWKDKLTITDDYPFIFLSVTSCDICNQYHFLSAEKYAGLYTEEGFKEEITPIFSNAIVTKENVEEIKQKLLHLLEDKNEDEDENRQKDSSL